MNRTPALAELPNERREYPRFAISIAGRYMLPDKREFPCRTIDFSLNCVSLAMPFPARQGERIVAYLDYIGRIEGTVIRQTVQGVVLILHLSRNKRNKLADQLTYIINRDILGQADRRHDRIVPYFRHTTFKLMNGQEQVVKLVDLSISGAAIETSFKSPIGTRVQLGSMEGYVIRHFEGGMAVEFDAQIPIERFGEDIRL